MNKPPTRILLVEDNPGDVRLLRELLAEVRSARFDITHADSLAKALKHLAAGTTDVVLLDLTLSDSSGLATMAEVYTRSPDVPIVILSGMDDETLAIEAVQAGAEDCLVKGQVSGTAIARTLHHAIERHRLQTALRSLSPMANQVGLYSRRGFFALAEQYLVLSQHRKQGVVLLLIEVVTKDLGSGGMALMERDAALAKVAKILRVSLRPSDIIAHLGENLFAVLMIDVTAPVVEAATARLQQNLRDHAAKEVAELALSLNSGAGVLRPGEGATVEQLLQEADRALDESKRRKQQV